MKIQPRLAELKPSDTLTINNLSRQMENQGRTVYKFGFGQSPFPVPRLVQEALKQNAHQKDYLPVQGLVTLREKIADHTNKLIDNNIYNANNVFVGPGSKELIYLAQLAIDAPLLLPNPSWVSYAPQAKIIGKEIHWIPTRVNHWKLEAEELRKYLEQQNIRHGVLLLNYPNNPTGLSFSVLELQALADVCKQYGIIVISDEIYGLLNFKGQYLSIASYYPEGTIITTGLSKWAGAGGWRLGAMIIPDELKQLYKNLQTLASETFSAVSAPIQFAACTAYDGDSSLEDYIYASRHILQTIAEFCHQKLVEGGVGVVPAEGGFYLFPNFTGLVETTDAVLFCQQLLQETGVALLPGTSFGRPTNELTTRLCYVDFDGEVALKHFYRHGKIEAGDMDILFPSMVKGISQLMQWVGEN
nr:pyridoxal phosphate-dependent aminotransferase [uncultured Allomuricauda sp.]